MNLSEASQIVSGLVLAGRCSPDAVPLTALEPPYDKVVRGRRDGMADGDLVLAVGLSTWNTAVQAASEIPETEEVGKFIVMLTQVAAMQMAGVKLKKYSDKLLRGEAVAPEDVMAAASALERDDLEWVSMADVEAETDIWRPTYWEGWDEYFRGVPRYGLVIIGAPPGTGKTTAVIKLIDKLTRRRKHAGFMSLELTAEVVKMRWSEISPNLSQARASYLHITDMEYDIDGACASIARLVGAIPEIETVFIDFADMLNQAEESTENAGIIYMRLAKLAKKLQIRIFLISQLSRKYDERGGGIPHVTDIRYSGLAEAMASMIVLLYNPNSIFAGADRDKSILTYVEGEAYIILGKSRFGFKMDSPGAIRLDWMGAMGWGDRANAYVSL